MYPVWTHAYLVCLLYTSINSLLPCTGTDSLVGLFYIGAAGQPLRCMHARPYRHHTDKSNLTFNNDGIQYSIYSTSCNMLRISKIKCHGTRPGRSRTIYILSDSTNLFGFLWFPAERRRKTRKKPVRKPRSDARALILGSATARLHVGKKNKRHNLRLSVRYLDDWAAMVLRVCRAWGLALAAAGRWTFLSVLSNNKCFAVRK